VIRLSGVSRWLAALGVAATCGALPQVKAASVPPSGVSAAAVAAVKRASAPDAKADKPGKAASLEAPHAHSHHGDAGATPEALAERQRLIDLGEASLKAGEVDAARHAFEQAANMAHMAEIELGLLRTQMQAGEYRQALAFAAHTAGVHLDEVEGAAFYAWLLNLGAQVAIADQALQPAEAREPTNAFLRAVRARVQSDAMLASGDLLRPPARLAPFATGAMPSPTARAVATGFLLADGQRALVPRAALQAGAAVWLRNGLGQTVKARLAPTVDAQARHADHSGPAHLSQALDDEGLGLAMLQLDKPLPAPGGELVPPRDAFPGSPAFALTYLGDDAAAPAWPLMRAGFVGTPLSLTSPWYRLGVALPVAGPGLSMGPRGGPVYDAGGRLLGVALRVDGVDRLVPTSTLRERFGERFGKPMPEPRPGPVGADEVYERAMKTTLQVLVALP